jgi:hypothetical protein
MHLSPFSSYLLFSHVFKHLLQRIPTLEPLLLAPLPRSPCFIAMPVEMSSTWLGNSGKGQRSKDVTL